MSIVSTELICNLSLNPPTADGATTGGAIDTARRPTLTQLASNKAVQIKSDGADTRNTTITGRKPDSTIAQQTAALTGATPVDLTTLGTIERVLKGELASGDASRTVTVETDEGSPILIATIPPNERGFQLLFYDASSGASQIKRVEKVFWRNSNSTDALTNAKIQITSGGDPSGKHRMAVEDAKGDSSSLANRVQADPATALGLTFVDDAVQQNVPTGNLGPSENIGVWIEQDLSANNTPIRSTVTLELAGQTA